MDAVTYCYECNKDVRATPGDHAMWHALAKKSALASSMMGADASQFPREVDSGILNKMKDRWVVKELLDGTLVCSCTYDMDRADGPVLSKWCEHIEKVIRNGVDAIDPVLGEPDLEHFAMPGGAWVPIRPTKDFYVAVAYGGIDEVTGDCEVFIEPPVPTKDSNGNPTPNGALTIPQRSIGYIYKGDGRMALRSMVIEWLRGRYKVAPQCKGAQHHRAVFSRSDARLIENAAELTQHLEDIYYLTFTGRCKPCRANLPTDFEKDVPDL